MLYSKARISNSIDEPRPVLGKTSDQVDTMIPEDSHNPHLIHVAHRTTIKSGV